MKMTKYYFAYGSNTKLDEMFRRCKTAKVFGKGTLYDYELLFRGPRHEAMLTIEPQKGAYVPILIFTITESDEHALDVYENFPELYRKEAFTVTIAQNSGEVPTTIDGFAYVMNYGDFHLVPHEHYYQICEEGFRQNEMDLKPLQNALAKCK